jgi:hypothetical protein
MSRKFNVKVAGIEIDVVALLKTSKQILQEICDIAVVVGGIIGAVGLAREKVNTFMRD